MKNPASGMPAAQLRIEALQQEITALRQAHGLSERAPSKSSELRHRALFDAIDDGFCIIEKLTGALPGDVSDFRCIEVNAAFVALTGRKAPTDVVGQTIRGLYPAIDEALYATCDAVLETGQAVRFEHELTPGVISELHVFAVVPCGPGQLALICKDITRRRTIENDLRFNLAFHRSLTASSSDCIKVLDLAGKLLSIESGQVLLGITNLAPYLNQPWLPFWKGADLVSATAAVAAAAGGGIGKFVGFFRTPGGLDKWWDVVITPIAGANGLPERLLAMSRDVTERELFQMQLGQRSSHFEALLNNAPVSAFLIDSDFRLQQINAAGRPDFAEIEPLIGRDFAEIAHIVWPPTRAAAVVEIFVRVLRTGESYRQAELAEIRADSQVTQYYDWQVDRILLPDSRYGVVCYLRDVSEGVLAREKNIASEFRIRYAAESAGLTYVEIDLTSGLAQTADNFVDVLGFAVAEGRRSVAADSASIFLERTLAADRERVAVMLHDLLSGVPEGRAEYRVVGNDGIQRWIETRWSRVHASVGRTAKTFLTNLNISERKRSEVALIESEQRYRKLFDSIDEGFCIVEVLFDANGHPHDFRFIEANPAFDRQTGLRALPGVRMREIVPDHEAEWFELLGKVALGGQSLRIQQEAHALGRWFDLYAFRVGGADSRKVAAIFTDITERLKVAESMRLSERRFRSLFHLVPTAMYTVDASGIIEDYNQGAADLWGREPVRGDVNEKFCGALRLFDSEGSLLPHAQTPIARVLQGEASIVENLELTFERPDGSRVTAITSVVALHNEEGRITGALKCLFDITERSRMAHQLQEQALQLQALDRRKDEFLAMLGHELRNPLAPIANAVQLLNLLGSEAEPNQVRAVGIIDRQVQQLNHLVDDLLEVSRITSGRIQLREVQVALGEIAMRAVESTQPVFEQYGHTLPIELPAEPIWLRADPARLEQVVVNLLTNAAKYTNAGGTVCLTVAADGADALLSVQDNGIGIAPDLLPHVFDLFTQAERSLDRAQGGLGIGLSLVQQLVTLHGGSVDVQSVPGSGSTFTARVPRLRDPLKQPREVLPSTGAPPAVRCKVLVVDDNVDAAETLATLLEMGGYPVQTVHEGSGVMAATCAWLPDAVLLDIGLPGLNGHEVARLIRCEPALAGVVLIALTGYGQASDRQQSRDAGFDHHLVKPADFDEITALLADIVPRDLISQAGFSAMK
jgi:PAS domain S-box-containing protein